MGDYEAAIAQVRQVGGEPVDSNRLFVSDVVSPRISIAKLTMPVESDPRDITPGILIMGPDAVISFKRVYKGEPTLISLAGLRSATLTYQNENGSAPTVVRMGLSYSSSTGESWVGDFQNPTTGPERENLGHYGRLKIMDGLTIQGFRGAARLVGERVIVDNPRLVVALQFTDGKV